MANVNEDKPLLSNKNTIDRWIHRRRMMTAVIVFCMTVIVYSLYKDSDKKIYDTAITMAFLLMGSTVATYVTGAVYDDSAMRRVK